MSDMTTPEERMEKALARAQAFVKLHGHDNTACITSGELFLFREAIQCAQTEIEHWDKLYLMMSADEQRLEADVARLTKMVGNFASIEAGRCADSRTRNGMPLNDMCTVQGQIKAARRAVAAGGG